MFLAMVMFLVWGFLKFNNVPSWAIRRFLCGGISGRKSRGFWRPVRIAFVIRTHLRHFFGGCFVEIPVV